MPVSFVLNPRRILGAPFADLPQNFPVLPFEFAGKQRIHLQRVDFNVKICRFAFGGEWLSRFGAEVAGAVEFVFDAVIVARVLLVILLVFYANF